MPDLKISSDFTIDDIHKIREYNYEMTKNMTLNERNDYYSENAKQALERIEQIRKEKDLIKF
jgi:uncharacterized protein (UPF0305 family)